MEPNPTDFQSDPMEEIYAMRMVRAGFLDVAIEIEADLRLMLIDLGLIRFDGQVACVDYAA